MSLPFRIHPLNAPASAPQPAGKVRLSLEWLPILSEAETVNLLEAAFLKQGFRRRGPVLFRVQQGLRCALDLAHHRVAIRTKSAPGQTSAGLAGPNCESADSSMVSDWNGRVQRLRFELERTIHQVTAAALRQKGAELGRIKNSVDDPGAGILLLKIEV